MLTLRDIEGVHSPGGLGRHDQCKFNTLLGTSYDEWLKICLVHIDWRGSITPYDNDIATSWGSAFM